MIMVLWMVQNWEEIISAIRFSVVLRNIFVSFANAIVKIAKDVMNVTVIAVRVENEAKSQIEYLFFLISFTLNPIISN